MPKWLHICGQNKQPTRSRFEKVKQASTVTKKNTKEKEGMKNKTKPANVGARRELKIQFSKALG